ncbi:MAG: hypothetical protein H0T79_10580 [Deltaproteobacteria bacterium]|nr:hypothetical protein [Deltaproteobacteria bacterium]
MATHTVRGIGVGSAVLAGLTVATTLATLEDVLRAGFDVVEVVVQDEFTHDVVASLGHAPPYVCFDTT